MKRILFLMSYPLAKNKKHHTQKYDGQIRAAKNLGYDVWFTGYENGSIYLCNNNVKNVIGRVIHTDQNIIIFNEICKSLFKIIKKYHFDYCYMRYSPCLPSINRILKELKKDNAKNIVEIPTYPWRAERKSDKRKFRQLIIFLLSFLFEKKMCRYIDIFTLIGDHEESYCGVKAINIENGVDMDANELRTPKNDSNDIHILALAKMAYWHGYDRLIEGLHQYKLNGGTTNVIVHMVGNDGDGSLAEWKSLVHKYNLYDSIVFDGLKIDNDLNEMFENCDIGIASLGLYRIGLYSASILKIREYISRGLPFVYSTKDNSIDPDLNFCLKINDDDSPVDMKAIINFALNMKSNSDIPQIMRNYAKTNLSWERQFIEIFKHV